MRLIAILLLCSIKLMAQDTIRFLNKEAKVVKIDEIGINDIKYHAWNNPDGPLYVASKREIEVIKYKNGTVDEFNKPVQKIELSKQNTETSTKPVEKDTTFYKMEAIGKKLVYKGREVKEGRIFSVIYEYPYPLNKPLLLNEAQKMKKFKKRQWGFGIGAIAGGLAIPYAGIYLSVLDFVNGGSIGSTLIPASIGGGLVVAATGLVLCKYFQKKKYKQKAKIAELYNERR
jgi:hypothetical protein